MDIELREIRQSQQSVLENLFSYYVYDMTEFMGWSIPENGQFIFDKNTLTSYWNQEDHIPYFIYIENEIAGFALLRRYPQCKNTWDIEQFFILRKFKGQGVGKQVFHKLTSKYRGQWQIRVLKQNTAAMMFWIAAVESVVRKKYHMELDIDIDLEMHFVRFCI
ncbi:GNAT family N-acetyltransferase [Vibrio hepatarius]|uniref:GNAT family N-acetyltransferase n=1 Tax=Vibrio hepatarius TaxID=171383 RepID=UPI001C08B58C|nr:GNAT family N-acetyltransferase [Vibrio hepatarius]MBU2899327.1 GNAT family N-acetyltransferase [Vibrio hepatarius]